MQLLIITSAIVGAEVTKAQQPFLPITPEEIIQSAIDMILACVLLCYC